MKCRLCTIAVCDKRKMTDKEVTSCFTTDYDGAGYAVADGKRVYFMKGFMNLKSLLESYATVPEGYPHIVHFRTQTTGGRKASLTHPFLISETSPIRLEGSTQHRVLFHNGVYSDWRRDMSILYLNGRYGKVPKGDWSDSRFAAILAYRLGEDALEWASGKWAVLDKTGEIRIRGDFTRNEDIVYSNMRHASSAYTGVYAGAYAGYRTRSYMDDDYFVGRDNYRYPTVGSKAAMGLTPRTGDI